MFNLLNKLMLKDDYMNSLITWTVIYPEDRNQQFLINGCALEDAPKQAANEIKEYHQALHKMIQSSFNKEDLTFDMINNWNQLITKTISSISLSELEKAAELISALNTEIKQIENLLKDVEVVSLLGEYTYNFQQLKLFSDTKRRIELLVLNYMMCRFRRPLIVINATEKETLIKAEQSPSLMKIFIADKVREVVLSPDGELLTRQSQPQKGQASEIYKNNENQKRIIEWHALFSAINEWQKINERVA